MLHSGELPPRVDVLECGYKREDGIYPTLTHISWKATGNHEALRIILRIAVQIYPPLSVVRVALFIACMT